MEQKTTGKFLSALRKEKGYTQQQVADFLSVSNRAVSKWECDDGYPETTILLAIADLYGVTADEILRGERAENKFSKSTTSRTEEHTKLFLERIHLKFKNLSIISIALGVAAAFLSYIFYYIVDHNLYLANIFLYLIVVSSVIILAVACNNYLTLLKSENAYKNTYNEAVSKVVFFISLEVFLVITAITGTFFEYFLDFIYIVATIFIAIIVALIVNIILNRSLKGKLNPQIEALRNRIVKKTIVSVVIICVLSFILPLPFADVISQIEPYDYDFNAQHEMEDIETRAPIEYNNLKDYFENGRELYRIFYYCIEDGRYEFEGYKLDYVVGKNDDGYYIEESGLLQDNESVFVSFETQEEANDFYKNHTITVNIEKILDYGAKEINFIDDEYRFTYRSQVNLVKDVYDILPGFCLIGGIVCIVILIVNFVTYNKRKHELELKD